MENTQRDNNPLQLWCTLATETHYWNEPTPDKHSWSLEQGTLEQIEASLWEQSCECFTGELEEDEDGSSDDSQERWADAVSSNVNTYHVPYDPTNEDHQRISGFEHIRPEHHEWALKEAKRKLTILEEQTDSKRAELQRQQRKLLLQMEALEEAYDRDNERLTAQLKALEV